MSERRTFSPIGAIVTDETVALLDIVDFVRAGVYRVVAHMNPTRTTRGFTHSETGRLLTLECGIWGESWRDWTPGTKGGVRDDRMQEALYEFYGPEEAAA